MSKHFLKSRTAFIVQLKNAHILPAEDPRNTSEWEAVDEDFDQFDFPEDVLRDGHARFQYESQFIDGRTL